MKKKKFWLYVILEIVTLGIYGIFFWYKWTEDVNKLCEGDDKDSANYILVAILDCFSLTIYSFVWNYQMLERLYQKAPEYGVELKHGGVWALVWRFFLPVVCSYTKVKYLNKLIDAYNASNAPVQEAPASEAAPAAEEAPVAEVAE